MNIGKLLILAGLAIAVFGLWKSNQNDDDKMAKVRAAKAAKAEEKETAEPGAV